MSVHGIEQDIVATRSRLNDTIDRIQDKLTLSGIVDDVMGTAGIPRVAESQDYIMGLVRRHPLPVMLVAAGVGWLVYRMNRRPHVIYDGEDLMDVPVITDGQARVYDPDLPTRHPGADLVDTNHRIAAQA